MGHAKPEPAGGSIRFQSSPQGDDSRRYCGWMRISEMGELTDKIKGNVNEAVGKVKQHSKDPATRDDGARQETRGKGEQLKGSLKGMLGDDI
jgi:uncharacterized protein YjbJ (UPF0337 family)